MPKKPRKFYRKAPLKDSKNSSRQAPIKDAHKSTSIKTDLYQTKTTKELFPKNNRSIPDTTNASLKLEKKEPQAVQKSKRKQPKFLLVLFSFIGLLSLIGIMYIGMQAKQQYIAFEKADAQRNQLETKFTQLEETAIAHPGSRDIYLQLAQLAYELKDMEKAKGFTERALTLDPNYRPALELNEKLSK